MGTTPSPEQAERQSPTRSEDGMAVIATILSGIILYGGLGWVGDHFLHTSWMLPLGLIVGLMVSIYLVYKRYGSVK